MYTYTATKAYSRGGSKAQYAFGDINGDGVPELHISGAEKYHIYTYQRGKVVLLFADMGRIDGSVDDKGSISFYYARSLDVFSGRSKWKSDE